MSPFQLLRIPADADEREIKRAYARLLRHNRPDDDAAAFQRLQEAYSHCLDIARARAAAAVHGQDAGDEDHGHDEHPEAGSGGHEPGTAHGGHGDAHAPPPVPRPPAHHHASDAVRRTEAAPDTDGLDDDSGREHAAPPPEGSGTPDDAPVGQAAQAGIEPQERYFDVAGFVEAVHGLLAQPSAQRMRDWLYAQEPLYSVYLKQALRPVVVQALEQAPDLRQREVVAALLAFFSLDQIDRDGMAQRVQAILDAHQGQLEVDRIVRELHETTWFDRRIGRELADRGVHPLRRTMLMLLPGFPGRIRKLLAQLRAIDPALRHESLDPDAVSFWTQASDAVAIHRPRVVLAGLRAVVWTAVLLALVGLLAQEPIAELARLQAMWSAGSFALWGTWALVRLGWHEGAAWTSRRGWMNPTDFGALYPAVLGVTLSWIPGLTPFPALVGVGLGHLRMFAGVPTVARIASVFLAAGYAMGAGMALAHAVSVLDGDTRATLVLTIGAVPLALAPLLRRIPRLTATWAPWLVAQALVAATTLGVLALL